jgi:hypothetical protein
MLQVLVVISQKFCCREEACGYAKVIHKKRVKMKKRIGIMDKCLRYPKQWVLRCPPKKREERKMSKIVHVLLKVVSKF